MFNWQILAAATARVTLMIEFSATVSRLVVLELELQAKQSLETPNIIYLILKFGVAIKLRSDGIIQESRAL